MLLLHAIEPHWLDNGSFTSLTRRLPTVPVSIQAKHSSLVLLCHEDIDSSRTWEIVQLRSLYYYYYPIRSCVCIFDAARRAGPLAQCTDR